MISVVLGMRVDQPLQELDGALDISLVSGESRFEALQRFVVGLLLQSGAELFGSRVGIVLLLQDRGDVQAGVGVPLVVRGDAAELPDRVVVGVRLLVHRGDVVANAVVVGLGRQHEAELRGRPFEVAGFKEDEANFDPGVRCIGTVLFQLSKLVERVVILSLPDV